MDWIYNAGSDIRFANLDSGVVLEGLGFNLCVASFLNICVPNFELYSMGWRWSEFGQRDSTRSKLSVMD